MQEGVFLTVRDIQRKPLNQYTCTYLLLSKIRQQLVARVICVFFVAMISRLRVQM